MSFFLLPKSLCNELEMLMCGFLWGDSTGKKRTHWMSWERMCKPKKHGGLGLRNPEAFNLALLAKQGWRLCQEPDSLAGQLLKARYFPRSDFLGASLGHNPSYGWRSIFKAREVLEAGSYWQVGNGVSLNVWRDRWIPRPSSFRVVGNFCGAPNDLQVSELIDWSRRCWKEELLADFLLPCDVEVVSGIHLVDSNLEDRQTWYFSKSGSISVKSAYHVAMELVLKSADGGQGSENSGDRLWKALWDVQVIPRTKFLLWRAGREVLPCKELLVRRKIIGDSSCLRCGLQESVIHCLRNCSLPRKVWNLFENLPEISGLCYTFLDWFDAAAKKFSKADLGLWAAIIGELWRARNELVFEGRETDAQAVADRASQAFEDYQASLARADSNVPKVQQEIMTWSRPEAGWLSICCDGSVRDRRCGVGIIGRSNSGEVVFYGAKRIQEGLLPEIVEAEAILWGIQVAISFGYDRIVVESDCKKCAK